MDIEMSFSSRHIMLRDHASPCNTLLRVAVPRVSTLRIGPTLAFINSSPPRYAPFRIAALHATNALRRFASALRNL